MSNYLEARRVGLQLAINPKPFKFKCSGKRRDLLFCDCLGFDSSRILKKNHFLHHECDSERQNSGDCAVQYFFYDIYPHNTFLQIRYCN